MGLVELKGFMAIKMHTSNRVNSGTDYLLEFNLKFENKKMTHFITLDNPDKNDRERGQTDIYKGKALQPINDEIRDYLEYFPDKGKMTVWLFLTAWGAHRDEWNPDLLKMYFAGK